MEYMDCDPDRDPEEIEVEWEGDGCFDDMQDLLKFGGCEEMEEWDLLDIYSRECDVFTGEEEKYLEELSKKVDVPHQIGTPQLKIKYEDKGFYHAHVRWYDYENGRGEKE